MTMYGGLIVQIAKTIHTADLAEYQHIPSALTAAQKWTEVLKMINYLTGCFTGAAVCFMAMCFAFFMHGGGDE